MEIELAKSAGFCFGVTRAIKMVYKALNENKKICTLGNIIHNQNITNELLTKGVRVINDISEIKNDEMVVIRSHGVSKGIYDKLPKDIILDGTCPFVSKIHQIVSDFFIDNQTHEIINQEQIFVIIIGDKNHPEIKGIEGHCVYNFVTVANSVELNQFVDNNIRKLRDKYIKVVTQTTYKSEELEKCKNILSFHLNGNYEVFDTICNETKKRQSEALEMSKIKDLMIVIGDKNSSNTQKLFDVCNQNCKTIFTESSQELEQFDFKNYKNIGVTAGASTPSNVIADVISKLKKIDEINNNEYQHSNIFDIQENQVGQSDAEQNYIDDDNDDENFDFTKEVDKFCDNYNLSNGTTIKGKVIGISPTEIQVDVGNRYDAYLPVSEISYMTDCDVQQLLKVGDVLDCLVTNVDDSKGLITLSKKKLDKIKAANKIENAYQNDIAIEGIVTKILNDGVIASVSGVNVYINQSQLCPQKVVLTDLLNQKISFKITYCDRTTNRFKGSVRELKKQMFWSKVKISDVMMATVKSLTNFGAFVDLDGEEGLIFTSDLSWSRINHPSEILKIGDVIKVKVKHLDFEKKRVTLEYKKAEENPWLLIKNKYNIGDILNAKIVSITPFGAFAQILPGVDGLIHISDISDQFVKSINDFLVVGDVVTVKIIDIDFDKKKVFLSLKDVN